ncbi:hypothetical protein [Stutzerimonas nitrititolerans]|uniref:hypothetical protein n=1 Tax=Stutzerimonas nitrititolerans TaxID=2482751 RepID=UPI00289975D9|nr:hypothetical protein [Stutzerimonas nitrititolerans]
MIPASAISQPIRCARFFSAWRTGSTGFFFLTTYLPSIGTERMHGTCYRMPGGILLHGSKKGKGLNVRDRQDADEHSAERWPGAQANQYASIPSR